MRSFVGSVGVGLGIFELLPSDVDMIVAIAKNFDTSARSTSDLGSPYFQTSGVFYFLSAPRK